MSITMNLYYTGVGGNARRFAEEMESTGIAQRIRAGEGNLKYEYFIPLQDSETVLLIDSWENQEAIDRHHASPMMKEIAQLREKYDLHMTAERYVSDENGIPQQDSEYIRK
ncbi:MAG: antibiotic biosynthesis monooxygenase [Lachnospiraceae bacterium]|nr:antibiotic biosynthesis monooxygenase [Lachnospiraceae bacterium]